MQFSEAQSKLKDMAEGRYHSISIDISVTQRGKVETSCRVYIDGLDGVSAPTAYDEVMGRY